jgi:hypothetical protein
MNKDITNTTLLMIAELAGEHTMPDGSKLQITVVEQAKTETEVSAKFEDCFKRVDPLYCINSGNEIEKYDSINVNLEEYYSHVPTERNAKQLQAFAKLLVIMHDLNGGEWIPEDGESAYGVYYRRESNNLSTATSNYTTSCLIYFRTKELARKALVANEQIFRDFYGV